jgi:hypothetical protein
MFCNVSVNQSVPTEANRGLTSYICIFSALLSVWLIMLPPIKFIVSCAVVGQSARANEAVDCVVHVIREDLWMPHNVSDTKENNALGNHPFLGYQIQRRMTLWETTLSQGVRYKEEPGGS